MHDKRPSRRASRGFALGLGGTAVTALGTSAALAAGVSLLYAGVQMPNSLVPSWLARPLAVLSVATVNSSGGLPVTVSDINTTQTITTPAPVSASVPPLRLGMNLDEAFFFTPSRIFMNLTMGHYWVVSGNGTQGAPRPNQVDANGNIKSLDAGTLAYRLMNSPIKIYRGQSADIVCRWQGTGTLIIANAAWVKNKRKIGTNEIRFTWVPDGSSPDGTGSKTVLQMTAVSAADPLRKLDCREVGDDPNVLLDPSYVQRLKGFDTLRFVHWANSNTVVPPVTWSTRTTPDSADPFGTDGYAIEHMVSVANAVHANPWFNIPWDGDANYVRKFAELVRDTLDPSLKVYVETSNEVWNPTYPVTPQAGDEGLAKGYGGPTNDRNLAMYRRLAERTTEINKIWKDVFRGQESRLVRVVSVQPSNTWGLSRILEFKDTAENVDAVAVAPYVNLRLDGKYTNDPASIAKLFGDMKVLADTRVAGGVAVKTLAASFGKRLVAYESGQHLQANDLTLLAAVQRDPRMGLFYTYYMTQWQQKIGDLMNHYKDVSPVTIYGDFGLVEYAGQPVNDIPKAKAFYLFMRSLGQ